MKLSVTYDPLGDLYSLHVDQALLAQTYPDSGFWSMFDVEQYEEVVEKWVPTRLIPADWLKNGYRFHVYNIHDLLMLLLDQGFEVEGDLNLFVAATGIDLFDLLS